MIYDFDSLPDRINTESMKWRSFPADVLPMFVADMDFVSPEPIVRALRKRVEHGVFGYPKEIAGLRAVIQERLLARYNWQIQPEDLVFVPGVVVGLNQACHAFTQPGEAVLMQPPVYGPFLSAPKNANAVRQEAALEYSEEQRTYSINWDTFTSAITDRTRMFMLCSPHNPVGRVFRQEELERLAEICLRQDILILSDEIHCDLVYSGVQHIPIASLDPEIARKTITLMAPSKTFNIAGLNASFAVIPNPDLRKQFQETHPNLVGGINLMGWVAMLAAFQEGQEWLEQLMVYLEANRDTVYEYIKRELKSIRIDKPEGTYLAWLDCRGLNLEENPQKFFLEKARVAMSDGRGFGLGGEGFVRLNFGCPRSVLTESLERMKKAVESAEKPG